MKSYDRVVVFFLGGVFSRGRMSPKSQLFLGKSIRFSTFLDAVISFLRSIFVFGRREAEKMCVQKVKKWPKLTHCTNTLGTFSPLFLGNFDVFGEISASCVWNYPFLRQRIKIKEDGPPTSLAHFCPFCGLQKANEQYFTVILQK